MRQAQPLSGPARESRRRRRAGGAVRRLSPPLGTFAPASLLLRVVAPPPCQRLRGARHDGEGRVPSQIREAQRRASAVHLVEAERPALSRSLLRRLVAGLIVRIPITDGLHLLALCRSAPTDILGAGYTEARRPTGMIRRRLYGKHLVVGRLTLTSLPCVHSTCSTCLSQRRPLFCQYGV